MAEGSSVLGGTGNELDNILEGNSQDNTLQGQGGSDTLIGGIGNDILDGGLGVDILEGGTGDDLYIVDDAADTIIEAAGSDVDSVTATVSYTLSENVEELILQGADAVNGIGSSGDNTLIGKQLWSVPITSPLLPLHYFPCVFTDSVRLLKRKTWKKPRVDLTIFEWRKNVSTDYYWFLP